MNHYLARLSALASVLVLSFGTYAADVYQTSTIKKIQAGSSNHAIYFSTNDAVQNPAGCTSAALYGVDPADRDTQSILALLLTAKTTDGELEMKISGDDCYGAYPRIKFVILR